MGLRSFIVFAADPYQQKGINRLPDLMQRPDTTIVRCTLPMKRVFSRPLLPLIIGLLLRLFFLFRLPSAAGDTPLYENLASNCLHHRIYGIPVAGVLTPL